MDLKAHRKKCPVNETFLFLRSFHETSTQFLLSLNQARAVRSSNGGDESKFSKQFLCQKSRFCVVSEALQRCNVTEGLQRCRIPYAQGVCNSTAM